MDYSPGFDSHYLLAGVIHLFDKENALIAILVTKWKRGCLKAAVLAPQRIITWKHSSVTLFLQMECETN